MSISQWQKLVKLAVIYSARLASATQGQAGTLSAGATIQSRRRC